MAAFAEVCAQPRLDPLEPVAEFGSSAARIDQVVYPEGLGPGEGGARAAEALLDFAALGFRVLGCRDLAPERHRHPAFEGQRAPLRRGPGQDVRALGEVGRGGDPVLFESVFPVEAPISPPTIVKGMVLS